jgi:uncharacterized protein with PQ loop repeat
MDTSGKWLRIVGWAASIAAVLMYLTYIDQIRLNLQGQKGSILLPMAAIINCVLWTIYAAARPRRDWPMIVANIPGILLGALSLVTAL